MDLNEAQEVDAGEEAMVAGDAPKLGTFALWLDDALGYGKQASTEEWRRSGGGVEEEWRRGD